MPPIGVIEQPDVDMLALQRLAMLKSLGRLLTNHLDLDAWASKTLAEFIDALYIKAHQNRQQFIEMLNKMSRGGGSTALGDALTDDLWKILDTHYNNSQRRETSKGEVKTNKNQQKKQQVTHLDKTSRVLPGLAHPNASVMSMEQVIEEEAREGIMTRTSHRQTALKRPAQNTTRLSSPERWEIKQLVASGAMSATQAAKLLNEGFGAERVQTSGHATQSTPVLDSGDLEVEIELVDKEPPFLQGHHKLTADLSPVRVMRCPEGSLARAAQSAGLMAAERREIRLTIQQQQVHQQGDASTSNPGFSLSSQRLYRFMGSKSDSDRSSKDQSNSAPDQLPISRLRDALVKAVKENPVLIVVGETGSGKTTQLPQFLYDAGLADPGNKVIGCTQPRRVAAMSVAKRVSEERNTALGSLVGYTIRFEDCSTPGQTRIKYMTDGMLLRECLLDPGLNSYSVIMLDEAHERTVNTDVLFGLLKKAIQQRNHEQQHGGSNSKNSLRLIVTSATLDADRFAAYFGDGCPTFTIPGRCFPVDLMWAKEPALDYLEAALRCVLEVHLTEPLPGDILVFLTGQEEIDSAVDLLNDRLRSLGRSVPPLLLLPVYAALPSEAQSKIFSPAPPGARKAVLATNIAETSITIDGIRYVIDPGMCKQKAYNPRLGMDSLIVVPISQAQARQRAGRAGRTGPGRCFRLYTEQAFKEEMLPASVPEIQRANLANTVLTLKAMGINDLLHFDFMDPPPLPAMIGAMSTLHALGALDLEGFLTRMGRKMAEFPLDPPLAKTLLYAVHEGCSEEALSVVAMLSVQTVFYRPKERQAQADIRKAKFHAFEGDHLTLLNVYQGWVKAGCSSAWARENFIHDRALRRAQEVRRQLAGIMERYKQPLVSCGPDTDRLRRALCAGFFQHAAKRDSTEGSYRTLVDSQPVYIHPSSSLFGKSPEWLIYHELVLTTKEYMRECTTIDPRWLATLAPAYYRQVEEGRLSKRKRDERLVPLHNKFEGPDEWRISKQQHHVSQASRTRFK